MKILNLDQNTYDWHAWRAGLCQASEAGVIMGDAPSWMEINTWQQLMRHKEVQSKELNEAATRPSVNWVPPKSNPILDHGARYEPMVLDMLNEGLREDGYRWYYTPRCIQSTVDRRFGASLDGLPHNAPRWPVAVRRYKKPLWVEIKCPWKKEDSSLWKKANNLSVNWQNSGASVRMSLPAYIFWQLVHQAGCVLNWNGATEARIRARGAHEINPWWYYSYVGLLIFIPRKNGNLLRTLNVPIRALVEEFPRLLTEWYSYLKVASYEKRY